MFYGRTGDSSNNSFGTFISIPVVVIIFIIDETTLDKKCWRFGIVKDV